MAAPKYTDRVKAQTLRSLSLEIMTAALRGEGEFGGDKDFKKQLILRLASNVLPRLNEHTGEVSENGELSPILVKFIDGSETDKHSG